MILERAMFRQKIIHRNRSKRNHYEIIYEINPFRKAIANIKND
jgi:hypothetical protein